LWQQQIRAWSKRKQKTITTYNSKMLESYNQITKSPISPVLKTLIKQLFFILGEKFNPTVLKLDAWDDKCFVLPRRDFNSHHWYTAASVA
jgi:hypothetical protein